MSQSSRRWVWVFLRFGLVAVALALTLSFDFGSFDVVTQAAAQSCTFPQVPDANGRCCDANQLVEGPNGSVCPGSVQPQSQPQSQSQQPSDPLKRAVGTLIVTSLQGMHWDDIDEGLQQWGRGLGELGSDLGQFFSNVGNAIGGGNHLGMYLQNPGVQSGVYGEGGISFADVDNLRFSDSAGLLPAGTATNIDDTSGGGGISGMFDISKQVNLAPGRKLMIGGLFDYTRQSLDFDSNPVLTTAGIAGAGGNADANNYTFAGSLLYGVGSAYVSAWGALGTGDGSMANRATIPLTGSAAHGNFDTDASAVEIALGNVFTLRRPMTPTDYAAGLNLSGAIGYRNAETDSFTDSSGFRYGSGQTEYGKTDIRAKFFLAQRGTSGNLVWSPYITATYDQKFDYSSEIKVPNQVLLPGGDVVKAHPDLAYWGGELGLDVLAVSGARAGILGYVKGNDQTTYTGGEAYVRVPF